MSLRLDNQMAMYSWLILACLQFSLLCAESYKEHDAVPLYVNKVGPYYNPHETYHYYSMPVCRPDKIEHRSMSLGEVLDGDRMAKSLYKLSFKQDVDKAKLCSLKLGAKELTQLQEAIEDLYYFEFVVDDISIKNFVGQLEEGPLIPHVHRTFLWTHYHFLFEFNDDRIINANVTTKDSIELTNTLPLPVEVTHTYSVEWKHTDTKYENRPARFQASGFFPQTLEIHWLSVINSIVLVFLLVGFVLVILTRVLKSDFARYNVTDQERIEDVDEYGWKIIHTDVFRFPTNRMLFCAVLGVGSQLLCMMAGILLLALTGLFNVHRHGSLNTAGCFLYAFTAFIAGYVSCAMYKQMGFGHGWVRCVHLTSCLFAVPFFVIWSFQNSVALAYSSTQALPFSTIVLLMLVWLFIGYPLTVIGGIFGKHRTGEFNAPCRTKNIPREIPDLAWYLSWPVQCLIGGFLPFSAISVELYYIFATVWGREQYTLYGILALVFIILLSVTAAVAMALTYFQLTAEDYRWWWRSVFSAGSTGGFILLYSLFYYFERSNMSGLLQTIEFFSWTLLTCYAFFLALGTVSFFASLHFVRYIYRNIKMD